MGQVYQATDTKLNRQVALKILPAAFATDPDRLARFQREAQVLASLNHPNIAQIHGLEESGDTGALVLELVEGPTLADRISKGPIPLDEALPIAKQIAEALEAAHEAGVIHRDLKPANIKVREDGTVKVLDFGLAKALDTTPQGDPSQSPTLTAAATQMGVIMGTAAYMSPEQASGEATDKRSDIWSFGVVLFEMLTGQRVFEGKSVSHVLGAVLQVEPNWAGLSASTPQPLRRLLSRCLEKERNRRLRDIGDALTDLDEASAGSNDELSVAMPARHGGWRHALPLALGAALVAVVITALAMWVTMRPDAIPSGLIRFAITPSATAPFGSGFSLRDLAISSDGTQIVYVSSPPDGGLQISLRPIDQLVGAPLRGAENAIGPFFSPDGEWVGLVTAPTVLEKVSIFGGPSVTVTDSSNPILGASWGTDDQIIFGVGGGGLFRVSGGGGEPEPLTTLDAEQGETSHTWPSSIPGANAVLFVTATGTPLNTGQLAVLDLNTGEITRLGLAGVSPHYVTTGHLVYAAQDRSVRAVPFDAASLAVTGNPVPLVEGVNVKRSGAANFSISDNGRMIYTLGSGRQSLPRSLVQIDREGREEPLGAGWPQDLYVYPRFSPDGTRVAVAIADDADNTDGVVAGTDLWVLDLARGSRSRITFGGNNRFFPVWSPDGSQLTFADGSGATNRLLLAAADGSGETETLLDRDERQFPTSWGSDEDVLAIYIDRRGETARDLAVLPLDGDRTPVSFLVTPFQERAGVFSPNGRWLAYVSDESGQDEVYVRPYPGPGQEHTISTAGGEEPVWSPDGRELFFRSEDQLLVVLWIQASLFDRRLRSCSLRGHTTRTSVRLVALPTTTSLPMGNGFS